MVELEKKTNKFGVEIQKYADTERDRFFVKINYKNVTLERTCANNEEAIKKIDDFIKTVNSPEKISDYLQSKTGVPVIFKERKRVEKHVRGFRTKIKRNKTANKGASKGASKGHSPKNG
jgi:hypothetical protein